MPRFSAGRTTRAGLLLFASFCVASGCDRSISIKDLTEKSSEYKGKDVQIRGRVTSSFTLPPALRRNVYILSDGTGQMGVVTALESPEKNKEVTVKGVLQDVPTFVLPAVGQFRIAPVMVEEQAREVEGAK